MVIVGVAVSAWVRTLAGAAASEPRTPDHGFPAPASVEQTSTGVVQAGGTRQAELGTSGSNDRDRIEGFWRRIYDAGPAERGPEPEPAPPRRPEPAPWRDFVDHLIFRLGTTYTHNSVTFTGQPTRSLVTDTGPPGTVTREGFSFPQSFEGSDDRISSYLVLGTRGLGDPRLNVYFSLIRQQDLDGTPAGSPFQSTLDAFRDGKRTAVQNGYAEMNGLGAGTLSHLRVRVGRQFVFDTSPHLLGSPVIDGATAGYQDSRLDVTVSSGRRVNFFGHQDDDVAMGTSASYRPRPGTSGAVNYFFLPGLHRFALEATREIAEIRTGGFLTFRNADPIDLGLRAWYATNPWNVRAAVLRRLTDGDVTYDVFLEREPARGQNVSERRLSLFRVRPATEFNLDVDRQVRSWLSLGGGVAARVVDGGEGPFDNSFEQLTGRLLWTPFRAWDYSIQYRYRHVERSSTTELTRATRFDDISHAGEIESHDVNVELYYRFDSRLSARLGGYFGTFDRRSRLAVVNDVVTAGGYVQGRIRVYRMLEFVIEYGIDRGNLEFNPDISGQETFRVGFNFQL